MNRQLSFIENTLKRIERFSSHDIILSTAVNRIEANKLLYKDYFYRFMEEIARNLFYMK